MIKLQFKYVAELRQKYYKLDQAISNCENYIITHDLPYCDYRFYRGYTHKTNPKDKLKKGIRRIIRIMKNMQGSAFTQMLEKAQKVVREKKQEVLLKRKTLLLKSNAMTSDDKSEKNFLILTEKVDKLNSIIEKQSKEINELKTIIIKNFEYLFGKQASEEGDVRGSFLRTKTVHFLFSLNLAFVQSKL